MAATPKQPVRSFCDPKNFSTPGVKRAPLLGFKEACREFGVSLATLRGMMQRQVPAPPLPEFRHAKAGNYYNARDFRNWFAAAKKAQEEGARG